MRLKKLGDKMSKFRELQRVIKTISFYCRKIRVNKEDWIEYKEQ